MNSLKQFLFTVLTIGLTASVFFSCEDDFTEEDLLNLQNQLAIGNDSLQALRNAEALNQAGDLVSYLVKVVSNDNTPVEGATVSLLAAVNGTPTTTSLTTDADGQVYFDQVVIGGNVLSISSTGFFPITANVDFGQIEEGTHYEVINNEVIPLQVVESSILPLFSDGTGADVATLSGVVQIEDDLTNDTTEVVTGVEVLADLSNFATRFARDGSITPSLYVFDSALVVGRATSDASGNYTMQVPTTADGIDISVVVPIISRSQRLAAQEVDGVPLDRPEYFDVEAQFGPGLGSTAIPDVPGIIVQASAPNAAGAGFGLTLSRYGRVITVGTMTAQNFTAPAEFNFGDIIYQVSSVGVGYENSPQVTVTDAGSGTDAEVVAHVQHAITGLAVDEAGAGLGNGTEVFFDLLYDLVAYDATGSTDTTVNQVWDTDIISVFANASGEIVADSVADALATAISNDDQYFDPENPESYGAWIANLRLVGVGFGTTEPELTITADGVIEELLFNDGGEDYETPSFAFSGGGASTQAALDVVEYGTRWVVTPDNSGVTTAYNVLPEVIEFEYINIFVGDRTVQNSAEVTDPINGGTPDIIEILEVDGSGNIQLNDDVNTWVTNFNAPTAPRVLIEDPVETAAEIDVDTGFDVDENGTITTFSASVSNGDGYTARPTFTVEPAAVGAPGSGATIVATFGEFSTSGEFNWDGDFELTNPGVDYLESLNQATQSAFQGSLSSSGTFTIFTVRSGQTYVHDIDYGTGVRVQDYD